MLCGVCLFIPHTAHSQDISAEQSAAIHDLLSPLNDGYKPSKGDEKQHERAKEILKKENLLNDSTRPVYKEKGLLKKYGDALFLGGRTSKFAKDIARIHDILKSGNDANLKKAIRELYVKAGRKSPDDKALAPILKSLYGEQGAEPQETINHKISKPEYDIDIKHSKAGGRMSIAVTEKGENGKPKSRTVYQGKVKTEPTKDGKDLKREVVLEQACTNTSETDAALYQKLQGEWIRTQDGTTWTFESASNNDGTFIFKPDDVAPYRYKGSIHLGKFYGEHAITDPNHVGDNFPPEIRQIIAGMGQTFRVHLEICGDKPTKLTGTWSSQHATYNPAFMTVSRIHDPYDLALELHREVEDYVISDIKMTYGPYQNRIKSYLPELEKELDRLTKEQIKHYKAKREFLFEVRVAERRMDTAQKKLDKLSNSDKSEIDELTYELRALNREKTEAQQNAISSRNKGDEYLDQWSRLHKIKDAMEELSSFENNKLPEMRPTLDSLDVKIESNDILHSTRDVDPEVVKNLRANINEVRANIYAGQMHIKSTENAIKWVTERRDDAVRRATAQNKKVQAAYNTLVDEINLEVYARVGIHTLLDTAEIVIEGKSLPGMAVEAVSKLGQAIFITGMGKGVTMYNPEALFKKDQRNASHYLDPYTKNLSQTGQSVGKTTIYYALKEALTATDEARKAAAKKAVGDALRSTRRSIQNKAAKEAYEFDFTTNLVRNLKERDAQLARAIANVTETAEKAVIKAESEQIQEMLAKETGKRLARLAASRAMNESAEHLSKKIQKMTLEGLIDNGISNSLKTSVKQALKKGGMNIGRGLAWDALRGGVQTAIDFNSEQVWKNYLNTLFIADIVNRQMASANVEIAQLKVDIANTKDFIAAHEALLILAKEFYAKYLNDKIVGDTLHITSSSFKNDQNNIIIAVDPERSSHGENVYLVGDLRKIKLEFSEQNKASENFEYKYSPLKMAEYELIADDIMTTKEGVKDWRPDTIWIYKLPSDTKLSDISSNGRLYIQIEVQ